ncbi:hypothetical protein ACE1CI_14650 [Aerosakkonemataceae cyanobacterium BLCC-F50]|uniref:Uncharacterized protein n=1 Tax=Floridaenema flaviceps BLCC-F50 TaxID=3153642 RepID=A0ABV4XRT9_9CYAN
MAEQLDVSQASIIPRKTLVASVPSGEIRTEVGADGIFMVFDCDCDDALPYCSGGDNEAESLLNKGFRLVTLPKKF